MGVLDQFQQAGETLENSGLLAAKDVKSGEPAIIRGFEVAEVDRGKVPAVVLEAEGWTKTLVLNRTNGRALAALARMKGSEEACVGHRVTLQLVDSQYQGRPVKSIRVVV